MTAVIAVPWRAGVPSREMIWNQVRPAFEATGLQVVTGDSDERLPFNRSEARNRAVEEAEYQRDVMGVPPPDVYVFLDADTYLPMENLLGAVDRARAEGVAVYPYTNLMSMNSLTGESAPRINLAQHRNPEAEGPPVRISGNVVIPRDLFEVTGGWDERLAGYGWEDGALLRMLLLLGTVEQLVGTLVCIEHSRTEEERPDFSITKRPDVLDEYDACRSVEDALALAQRIREYREAHR